MRLRYYSLGFALIISITAYSQNDVTIGTNYQLNLQLKDDNADAWILHNAKSSSTGILNWVNAHPSFGARGIMFRYLDGIHFYANTGATTAGTTFTPTTRFFIGNNGNVGVGTSTPYSASRLHVKSPTAGPWGILSEATSNQRIIGVGHDGTAGIIAVSYLDGSGFSPLNLTTSNITRMTIATDGNVGIGTSNPSAKLEVSTAGTGTNAYVDLNSGSSNVEIRFKKNDVIKSFVWMEDTRNFIGMGGGSQNNSLFVNNTSGNVGIGNITPAYKLDVNGPINAASLNINGLPVTGTQWTTAGAAISYTGKVGIGTPLTTNPNNYTLAVNGTIGARDVRVEKSSTTWPDYVFEKNYGLPSLKELENYIQQHKHLEDVPSAREVSENGYSLNKMDVILLKKVEELSLYIIQQQKEIQHQQKEMDQQRKEIDMLKKKFEVDK